MFLCGLLTISVFSKTKYSFCWVEIFICFVWYWSLWNIGNEHAIPKKGWSFQWEIISAGHSNLNAVTSHYYLAPRDNYLCGCMFGSWYSPYKIQLSYNVCVLAIYHLSAFIMHYIISILLYVTKLESDQNVLSYILNTKILCVSFTLLFPWPKGFIGKNMHTH